ncbi:MAG: hypothetical protein PHN88_14880 [Ignavibacteria bacterium]|nr:hypothetical protein [Ignavibacteria bacterium]
MAKSKEKPAIFSEISSEKPEKIAFPAYKTVNFTPDIDGNEVRLQEKLNFMRAYGYDFFGTVPEKSNIILIFKLIKDNAL